MEKPKKIPTDEEELREIQRQEDSEELRRMPFDEYAYRKIIDACSQFINAYAELSEEHDNTEYLGNLLAVITEFAKNAHQLPEYLKHPEHRFKEGEISQNNIHPRVALQYVMDVFNELIRQQMDWGRDPDWALNEHERIMTERYSE